ncbi:MAG: hypothetical protein LW884_09385 [Bacteroidetes bacterium]|jgi:hypothetical protein|nr:hypothetical protein [Bacteroidota bacterium]
MIEIHQANHSIILTGTLEAPDLETVYEALEPFEHGDTIHVNLYDLDIEEGRPMASLTDLIKRYLRDGYYMRLEGPPQLLIHNLYRVGYHPHERLVVADMREDEAYG